VPPGHGHANWRARVFIGGEPFAILLPYELIISDTPSTKRVTVTEVLGGQTNNTAS
jgi:UTP--glucose-1-phosphate uridylyltransferase